MPRRYPPHLRREVLELIAGGARVADIAEELHVSGQTVYVWRRQARIDGRARSAAGDKDEDSELYAAHRRIAQLESEVSILRRAGELLTQAVRVQGRYGAVAVLAAEGRPVTHACRVLAVGESGYYQWRQRPPSARELRHAALTEAIRAVHSDSGGTFGARRVHAELNDTLGVKVGLNTVELLMRRAGLKARSRDPQPPTIG